MTLGQLASTAGLSKSGVVRHFPTKEELQLATLEHAITLFLAAVWIPVHDREPGLERLQALCEAWTDFLAGDTFPGGCFLTAASSEFDGRTGPIREAVRSALSAWLDLLAGEVRTAVRAGDLDADTDPALVAYQLNALAMAANQARQLLGDQRAPATSHALMRGVLTACSPRR